MSGVATIIIDDFEARCDASPTFLQAGEQEVSEDWIKASQTGRARVSATEKGGCERVF